MWFERDRPHATHHYWWQLPHELRHFFLSKFMSQCCDFALTVNNPEEGYIDDKFNAERMRSLVGQYERGESGTLHIQVCHSLTRTLKRTVSSFIFLLQACVSYKRSVRLSIVRAAFPGAHVTVRRRSREELVAYCTKEETREPGTVGFEFGEPFAARQGRRSDLARVVDLVRRDGVGAAAEEAPEAFIRYSRGIFALDFEFQRDAARCDRSMRVAILYGAAGSGKTRAAYEVCRCVRFNV